MIASVLRLSRADIKALKLTDDYSLHRVVYSLFEDVRSEQDKQASEPSGILYADKGGDIQSRQVILLSNRQPRVPEHGQLESKPIPANFLDYEHYRFEVLVNPSKRDKATGKTVGVRGREAVAEWFAARAPESWGFSVRPDSLQVNAIGVKQFDKKGLHVTLGYASLQGNLTVVDRKKFIESFEKGIGRGRAFGFGLLQIVPINNPFNL